MQKIKNTLFLLCLIALISLWESCDKNEECISINCNTGIQNEESCNCDCPLGFSGMNCEMEDVCITQNISCQNGGTCIDGACDCPDGFMGVSCETFDLSNIQALLDAGYTPKILLEQGALPEDFYGKLYQGGFIFYVNADNGTGMIAAMEDQNMEAKWGCDGTNLVGLVDVTIIAVEPDTVATARIGAGKPNTDVIVMECQEEDVAASWCRNLGEDWSLPSRYELKLMFNNLHQQGYGNFTAGFYWSSTEYDRDKAWFRDFDNGFHGWIEKVFGFGARAVRTF